ncbi:MAG: Glutamine--fructose-6-phosphate aminotransferase [isomerizing] [Wolbachia endosymbiont of Ctenocephalides orientis wCori]|nr:MAG: Glutamine--fructose-6-phosphate aminotransferase [isomerizing] [Wolbachia endosymbiont of Ctenocephalides orientis wCori]
MCGVFGVVSENNSVIQTLLTGLQKLEYRGYDSAGIAIINNEGKIEVEKSEGKVERLYKIVNDNGMSSSTVGIAHTRWATHGAPNLKNAHPIHTNKVVVAHNGIIENHSLLKKDLESIGIEFHTDTDTEIVPNMLTLYINEGLSPIGSLFKCLSKLHGSFALVMLFAEHPDVLFIAKRNLPLAIGYNGNSVFAASDTNALSTFVERISHLEDGDIAVVRYNNVSIYNKGRQVARNIENNTPNNFLISKNGYSSFMLKEIFDQPIALNKTINQFYEKYKKLILSKKKLDPLYICNSNEKLVIHSSVSFQHVMHNCTNIEFSRQLSTKWCHPSAQTLGSSRLLPANNSSFFVKTQFKRKVNPCWIPVSSTWMTESGAGDLLFSKLSHITLVGCGSSYFAGLIAKYWLESIAKVRVYLEISSELRYSNIELEEGSIGLFISQSGETADTIEALRYAKSKKQIIVGITNTFNSSIEKMSDIVLHTLAGPEVGVASTKTFSTQLAILACFAIELAEIKGLLNKEKIEQLNNTIRSIPKYVESVLAMSRPLSKPIYDQEFLGEVQASTAEYLNVFEERSSASTTKLPLEIEFQKKSNEIQCIAEDILKYNKVILIGRGSSYGVAMEGALKIKELSYINTIGIAAGEMKHGSIALIDHTVLVIAIIPYDNLFFKTLSNIQEIIARQGKVIAFSDKRGVPFLRGICHNVIQLPEVDSFISPIIYSVAMQLLAYFAAVKKELDPDCPRNLAKSVTVE